MNATAAIVCKSFLQKRPEEKRDQLFRFLSEDDQQLISEIPYSYPYDPTAGFSSAQINLNRIHYSWLEPLFRTFSENEVRLFLSALNAEQAKSLKKLLLLSNHKVELNPAISPFFTQTLWEKISEKELLPFECLPESPLNGLLELSPASLGNLLDSLGLHDLAIEVKQIIDTARLKKIYSALLPNELTFLKSLMHHKEPLTFKRMDLQTWDGKKSTLRALLRQRGVNRLAKALYQQGKSLLWHISHKLDKEAGEILVKLSTPLEHVRAQEILISQVTELLTHIQTPQPSKDA